MWSVTDFVVRGQFCPVSELQPAVERIAHHAGADAAILLAADEKALLRTLCTAWAVSDSAIEIVELIGHLSSTKGGRPRLQDLVRMGRPGTQSPDRFPRSAQRIVDLLFDHAKRTGSFAGRYFGTDAGTWRPALPALEAVGARVSCAVLLRNPKRHLQDPAPGQPVRGVRADSCMRDVIERVNATAHASVRLDGQVLLRLDATVPPTKIVLGTLDFEKAAALLTQLAVEVSQSQIGACYMHEPPRERILRISCHVPRLLQSSVGFPEEIAASSQRAAALCIRRHGREFHHHRLPDASPQSTSDHSGPPWPAELATPIPGPLASRLTPAVGVLTVARLEDGVDADPITYSAYDHALLRNIALRLALLRATTNVEAAGASFRALPVNVGTATWHRASETESRTTRGRLGRPDTLAIPDDITLALRAITEGLQHLAGVTNSHSATFRAALPDAQVRDPHGLSLVRLAASSQELLTERGVVQQLENGGVNWVAVRNGRPKYAPDIRKEKSYYALRHKTKSELSLPVSVEGRVVGVINLESPLLHGYDGQIATAQAFAERIALIIANARLAVSRRAQEYAVEIIGHGHEMAAECGKLRDLAPRLAAFRQEEVESVAEAIERKARGLRSFVRAEGDSIPATLPALFRESIASAQVEHLSLINEELSNWRPYNGQAAALLRECCYHVVTNIKRHAAIVGFRESELRFFQDTWGGVVHDIAEVRNVSKDTIPPQRAINMYRVPLERAIPVRASEPRSVIVPNFGAYLAGTLARLCGGDIYVSVHRGRDVRLTMTVPNEGALDGSGYEGVSP